MPYAYQRGDNCYGRGDYYRGDYYRGDPGIFGDIFKGIKKVAGTALRVVGAVAPGPIGMIARGLTRPTERVSFFPPEPSIPAPFGPMIQPEQQQPVGTMLRDQFIPGCQLKGTRPNKSGYYKQVRKGDPTNVVYIPPKSVCVPTRRMNVANPRALRRSIRRAQGFSKLARRVLTFVSARAPRGRAKFKRKR